MYHQKQLLVRPVAPSARTRPLIPLPAAAAAAPLLFTHTHKTSQRDTVLLDADYITLPAPLLAAVVFFLFLCWALIQQSSFCSSSLFVSLLLLLLFADDQQTIESDYTDTKVKKERERERR